ncbi:MAG: hypothetical protein Pg6A_03550 [Termitinemataceae bacterium]|nr:MAG: hypothetical protein Pg6A_03550 [Termitinemataceae bacterium]
MSAIIIVYGIYFILLIAAAVWFLRRCVITNTLESLRGLSVQAQCNEADNIVLIKNNFAEFYLGIPGTQKNNFPLLLLKQICADVEEGKNYSGGWYLSRYKKYHTKFLTAVILISFAAPLLAIFAAGIAGDSEYIAVPLIAFQSVYFLLTGILRCMLARNFDLFTGVFYKEWYDKLLNFDAMRFSIIQNKFSEEKLRGILSEMQSVYTAQSEALVKANTELAAQIQRLADEKQKGSIITVEGVTSAFEANLSRIEAFCANIEASAGALETSFKTLPDFTGKNKNALNTVNKMAGEFAELRETLLTHTSAGETAAIEKFDAISAALETDVHKTWTNIDETLTRNAKELSDSYEHFFELCKTLTSASKKGDDE